MRTSAALAAALAALRADARAVAGGVTSCLSPSPRLAVASAANVAAGASAISAMESPSRAAFARRTSRF